MRKNDIIKYLAISVLACLGFTSSVLADDNKQYAGNMTGGWYGKRSALSAKGVDLEVDYTLDFMADLAGGRKKGGKALDDTDIILRFDGDKLLGAEGLSAKLYFLGNNFSRPNQQNVSSSQGIDNIEVPASAFKLYEAWLQQNSQDNKFSLLAGLYNLNSEFYVTNSSSVFIHPTFGIGSEFGLSGKNGPSAFPYTSLASRFKVQITPDIYTQFAIADGYPGDLNRPKGTHIHLRSQDGALLINETGYQNNDQGKLAIGVWGYTRKLPDSLNNQRFKRNYGGYALIEKRLFANTLKPEQNLTAFLRFGTKDRNTGMFAYAYSTGFSFQGILPARPDGVIGIGFQQALNTKKYREAMQITGIKKSEYGFELTYQDTLLPWLSVQPDIQYIFNPGFKQRNALILGFRAKLSL